MASSRSYRDDLLKALQDPEEAKEYLNAALEDGNLQVFLLALRDVVDAKIGTTQLAEKTQCSSDSLYQTLSDNGNPALASVKSILSSLGYRLAVEIESK